MKSFLCAVIMIVIGGLAISCAKPAPPPASQEIPQPVSVQTEKKSGWEAEWEKTLVEAKKEGKVVIYSGLNPESRDELSRLFSKKYNLAIEWNVGPPGDLSQKVITQRKAGLFLADVMLGSANQAITIQRPAGNLDSLERELLLPEVTDSSRWIGNALPWADKEHYVISPGRSPSSTMLINTEMVKKDEVKSYMDLLTDKWKGKIVLSDPTKPGPSQYWAMAVGSKIMNWDFMKQIAQQDLVIVGDERQAVEWIARGKYPLNLGPSGGIVDAFIKAGASLELIHPVEGVQESAGYNTFMLFKNRPHPAAARIFLNWYLSREGQQVLADYDLRVGTRVDISTAKIAEVKLRKPGIKYFNMETEEFQLSSPEYIRQTREIFGPLVRK